MYIIKYKIKNDYLYETEADILWEIRGKEGRKAGKGKKKY